MIPKIIHYVWVGDNPKSELVEKCIASWKKYCPDYKIIEWNNESLKEINNIYVSEAFQCKKWAFVSDYLRLYALNKFGGVYCDTDLELTQNIDEFLNNDFFTGYENWEEKCSPITALMGAKKNNQIISDLLTYYSDRHFIVDGKLDLTTNVTIISTYFKERFFLTEPFDGTKITQLNKSCKIYPFFFFCTPENGKENYSIHHFNGSWVMGYSRKDLCSFRGIKIIKCKKWLDVNNFYMPILPSEEIFLSIPISTRKKLVFIKVKKCKK